MTPAGCCAVCWPRKTNSTAARYGGSHRGASARPPQSILAVMANQSSLGLKREQVAAADLTRQAQQIQVVARESQSEARRLAAAIDTLNSDRDRLYSRVTGLEQGLDSVTGAIARQGSAAASPAVAHAEPPAAQSPQPAGRGAGRDRPGHAARRGQIHCRHRGARPVRGLLRRKGCREDRRRQSGERQGLEAAKAEMAKAEMAKAEMAKAELAKGRGGKGRYRQAGARKAVARHAADGGAIDDGPARSRSQQADRAGQGAKPRHRQPDPRRRGNGAIGSRCGSRR